MGTFAILHLHKYTTGVENIAFCVACDADHDLESVFPDRQDSGSTLLKCYVACDKNWVAVVAARGQMAHTC